MLKTKTHKLVSWIPVKWRMKMCLWLYPEFRPARVVMVKGLISAGPYSRHVMRVNGVFDEVNLTGCQISGFVQTDWGDKSTGLICDLGYLNEDKKFERIEPPVFE